MTSHWNGNAVAERLEFAKHLAREAGRFAAERRLELTASGLEIQSKGTQDFVTIVDVETEHLLRGRLQKTFPGDGFLGEEGGLQATDQGLWVVDPIDGTANFMRNLADWAVSVAYVRSGQLELGFVYDGGQDKLYWAHAGHGAFCDDQPIHCSGTTNADEALGILGISRKTPFEDYLSLLDRLQKSSIEHRRMGAAALGLIRVAEGSADFYYEAFVNAWDSLGGLLIAQEAGATCAPLDMQNYLDHGGQALCATPALYDAVAALAHNRNRPDVV